MKSETLNSALHTLNKTQSLTLLNQQLSQCMSIGDALILIEDGVYQCMTLTSPSNTLTQDHWSHKASDIYVLADDAQARGIPIASIRHAKVAFISYPEFVSLTLKHSKVVSWY